MNEPIKHPIALNEDRKFEALKMLHDNHAELMRFMATLDYKIFGGYISLQLLLGSWLAEHHPATRFSRIGIMIIDGSLALVAAALIFNDFKRRKEVANTFNNINAALGFTQHGAYVSTGPLLAPRIKYRAWRS